MNSFFYFFYTTCVHKWFVFVVSLTIKYFIYMFNILHIYIQLFHWNTHFFFLFSPSRWRDTGCRCFVSMCVDKSTKKYWTLFWWSFLLLCNWIGAGSGGRGRGEQWWWWWWKWVNSRYYRCAEISLVCRRSIFKEAFDEEGRTKNI